jgi:hypothetical protein
MSYSLEWRCPACRVPDLVDLAGADSGGAISSDADLTVVGQSCPSDLRCLHCDHRQSFPADVRTNDGAWVDPLARCLVCGSERLFVQKDFNRKLGIAIVVVGAVLSPWTYGASLVVCMLIDYGLYYFVPEITVCYGCDAIHRGFSHNIAHRANDPMMAEQFRRKAQEEVAGAGPSAGGSEGGGGGAGAGGDEGVDEHVE